MSIFEKRVNIDSLVADIERRMLGRADGFNFHKKVKT